LLAEVGALVGPGWCDSPFVAVVVAKGESNWSAIPCQQATIQGLSVGLNVGQGLRVGSGIV